MAHLTRQFIKISLIRNAFNMRRCLSGIHTCLNNNSQPVVQNVSKNKFMPPIRRYSTAYEADGKTTVTLLNTEEDAGLMVNSYSQLGFRLNNNVFVMGPMAIFPKTVLSWNIESFEDINEHTLRLITLLEPKIDILILGVGDALVTPEFSKSIRQYILKNRINIEILGTDIACSTFNFLNSEGRMVAALLIPPLHLRINEDDLMERHKRHNLYELDEPEEFISKQAIEGMKRNKEDK